MTYEEACYLDARLANTQERNTQRMSEREVRSVPGFSDSWDYRGLNEPNLFCQCKENRGAEDSPLDDVWVQASSTEGKLVLSKLRKQLARIAAQGKEASDEDKPALRAMYRKVRKALEWMEVFHMNTKLGYDEEVTWWTKARHGRAKALRETDSVALLHKAVVPLLAQGKFTNGYWYKRYLANLSLNREEVSAAWNLWRQVHNRPRTK